MSLTARLKKFSAGHHFGQAMLREDRMRRTLTLLIGSLIVCSATAQSISLSGKILSNGNKPVIGAVVTLAAQRIKDTTDNQGAFSFSKVTFAVKPLPLSPASDEISMVNGIVTVNLTKASAVAIELFDLSGKLLAKTLDRPASAGAFRFDVLMDLTQEQA